MEALNAQIFNQALCVSFKQQQELQTPALLFANDKKAMLRLRTERDNINFKYNAVFNSTDNYYIILDRHLNIIDFNRASARLVKAIFGKELIVGHNAYSYLNGILKEPVLTSFKRALSGETFVIEREIDFIGDGTSWWQAQYSPAYDENNNIAGIIFNAMDITVRKINEAKIATQNEQLQAISLMQSHNIRGPLCTLMGLMSLIKLEDATCYPNYLPMMDTTINLLDIQIRGIVECASTE